MFGMPVNSGLTCMKHQLDNIKNTSENLSDLKSGLFYGTDLITNVQTSFKAEQKY